MALKRQLRTSYWDDGYVEDELSEPEQKLVYIYLLVNPHHSITGLYEISAKKISRHTGVDEDAVKTTLQKLEHDGKIKFDGREILLVNYLKLNWNSGKSNLVRYAADLRLIRNHDYIREWFKIAEEHAPGLTFTIDDVLVSRDEAEEKSGSETKEEKQKPSKKRDPASGRKPAPVLPPPKKTSSPTDEFAAEPPNVREIISHFKATVLEVMEIEGSVSKPDVVFLKQALAKNISTEQAKSHIEFCVDLTKARGLGMSLGGFFKPYYLMEYQKKWKARKGDYNTHETPPYDIKWWR